MQWKKSRITLNVWQDGDFKIVENPEANADERFRLDSFSAASEPEFFANLKSAQHAAAMRHELELTRAENARLRQELEMAKQAAAFPAPPPPIPAIVPGAPRWENEDMDRAIEAVLADEPADEESPEHDPWFDSAPGFRNGTINGHEGAPDNRN